jgi:hypothetical protein
LAQKKRPKQKPKLLSDAPPPRLSLTDRLRQASPEAVLNWIPYSLAAASVLVGLVVWEQTILQPKHANPMALLQYCKAGLAAAVVLALVFRKWGRALAGKWDPVSCKAYALALQVGLILLAAPAGLAVWHSSSADLTWYVFGFVDKRWLVSLYWLGLATFVVFPHAISAWLAPPAAPVEMADATPRRWLRVGAKTVVAIGMAWFYAGPPWHVATLHRSIDYHEQVHLGPLQAIDKGYLPAVGPASTQYGPGSQAFYYAFMKLTGQFTIVGFRNANASIHFLSVLIFAVFVFQLLKAWEAVLVVLLAMTYSPFRLLTFVNNASALGGFYGWTNEFRYLGVLLVAGTLPVLLRRWKRPVSFAALFLGAVWGLFSWLAQENLAGGMGAVALLLLLLWLTGTSPARPIRQVAANLAAGWAVFWLPVLFYYARHRAVQQFVRNYFLYPSAVAKGYCNSDWTSGSSDPQYRAFLFTAAVLVILGVCTLCDVRRRRLRSLLTARQTTLLSMIVVVAASYQSSLFRSDASHLINTFTALPVLLLLGCIDVPLWLAKTAKWQWLLRGALVALFLAVYPVARYLGAPYDTLAVRQLRKFQPVRYPGTPLPDARIPFVRATRYLTDEPYASTESQIKMRDFLTDASEMRDLIGGRKTLVVSHPAGAPGLIYFMADLTPAPFLLDKVMMVVNSNVEAEVEADMKKRVAEYQAVVAEDANTPEADIFLAGHPGAQTVHRSVAGKPYVIMLDASTQAIKGTVR